MQISKFSLYENGESNFALSKKPFSHYLCHIWFVFWLWGTVYFYPILSNAILKEVVEFQVLATVGLNVNLVINYLAFGELFGFSKILFPKW